MQPTQPIIIICNIRIEENKYGTRFIETPCITGTHIIIDNKKSFKRIHLYDLKTGKIYKLSIQRDYLEKHEYWKIRNEETRPEVIKQINQIICQAIS